MHEDQLCELDVTLLDVEPRVWRRLAVSAVTTLAELHAIIQTAMPWRGTHLQQFITEHGQRFTSREVVVHLDGALAQAADSAGIAVCDILRRPGDRLLYEYDFGDGWEHRIELVQARAQAAREPCAPGSGASQATASGALPPTPVRCGRGTPPAAR